MYHPASKKYIDTTDNFDYVQAVAKEFTFDYLCAHSPVSQEKTWEAIESITAENWEFDVGYEIGDTMTRYSYEVINRFGKKYKLSFSRLPYEQLWDKVDTWLSERVQQNENARGKLLWLSTNKHAGHEDGKIFKVVGKY